MHGKLEIMMQFKCCCMHDRKFNQSQLEVAILKDPYVASSSYSKKKLPVRSSSIMLEQVDTLPVVVPLFH